MLARVANNLFWMGRYIERSEHTARYTNVNYFSSLDAPRQLSQSRQFVLRSIRFMTGDMPDESVKSLDEKETLFNLSFNQDKNYSIINNVRAARENANSARDLISTELYEALNKFYHYVTNYPSEVFVSKSLYEFTVYVTEMSAILRSKIHGTLLHDEIYAIIMLGINIERVTQLVRIINAKYNDAKKTESDNPRAMENSYEWTTLLKCCECYDMHRRLNRKTPHQLSTLKFLLLNPNNPRSVMNSLDKIYDHIRLLDPDDDPDHESTRFVIGKLRSTLEFTHISEIGIDTEGYIENLLKKISDISHLMEEEYFNY
ncbi:alpha-E domain-containing protein [Robertkochia aurantiaca]|uniref:alpha-E domain-containing protein n=1 Tax=Robertkochia aurantiaca TaxID=2873700 RepID=UPI001CCC5406|nr:alpha-E domain-containing protein [Robertkochia sp. 3YJGBD-33]